MVKRIMSIAVLLVILGSLFVCGSCFFGSSLTAAALTEVEDALPGKDYVLSWCGPEETAAYRTERGLPEQAEDAPFFHLGEELPHARELERLEIGSLWRSLQVPMQGLTFTAQGRYFSDGRREGARAAVVTLTEEAADPLTVIFAVGEGTALAGPGNTDGPVMASGFSRLYRGSVPVYCTALYRGTHASPGRPMLVAGFERDRLSITLVGQAPGDRMEELGDRMTELVWHTLDDFVDSLFALDEPLLPSDQLLELDFGSSVRSAMTESLSSQAVQQRNHFDSGWRVPVGQVWSGPDPERVGIYGATSVCHDAAGDLIQVNVQSLLRLHGWSPQEEGALLITLAPGELPRYGDHFPGARRIEKNGLQMVAGTNPAGIFKSVFPFSRREGEKLVAYQVEFMTADPEPIGVRLVGYAPEGEGGTEILYDLMSRVATEWRTPRKGPKLSEFTCSLETLPILKFRMNRDGSVQYAQRSLEVCAQAVRDFTVLTGAEAAQAAGDPQVTQVVEVVCPDLLLALDDTSRNADAESWGNNEYRKYLFALTKVDYAVDPQRREARVLGGYNGLAGAEVRGQEILNSWYPEDGRKYTDSEKAFFRPLVPGQPEELVETELGTGVLNLVDWKVNGPVVCRKLMQDYLELNGMGDYTVVAGEPLTTREATLTPESLDPAVREELEQGAKALTHQAVRELLDDPEAGAVEESFVWIMSLMKADPQRERMQIRFSLMLLPADDDSRAWWLTRGGGTDRNLDAGYSGWVLLDDFRTGVKTAEGWVLSDARDLPAGEVDLYQWDVIPYRVRPYPDVRQTSWYCEAVRLVTTKGYFSGLEDGLFHPDDTMSRAMLVTALANGTSNYSKQRVNVRSTENPWDIALPYTDVEPQKWYAAPIRWGTRCRLVYGKEGELFDPLSSVTRQEAMTILYRYIRQTEGYREEELPSTEILDSFSDRNTVAGWAEEAMAWAAARGLLQGYTDGTLKPRNTLKRSEAAALLARAQALFVTDRLTVPEVSPLEQDARNVAAQEAGNLVSAWLDGMYGQYPDEIDDCVFRDLRITGVSEDGRSFLLAVQLVFLPRQGEDLTQWWLAGNTKALGDGYYSAVREARADLVEGHWRLGPWGTGVFPAAEEKFVAVNKSLGDQLTLPRVLELADTAAIRELTDQDFVNYAGIRLPEPFNVTVYMVPGHREVVRTALGPVYLEDITKGSGDTGEFIYLSEGRAAVEKYLAA